MEILARSSTARPPAAAGVEVELLGERERATAGEAALGTDAQSRARRVDTELGLCLSGEAQATALGE